jgi:hypothetical protein
MNVVIRRMTYKGAKDIILPDKVDDIMSDLITNIIVLVWDRMNNVFVEFCYDLVWRRSKSEDVKKEEQHLYLVMLDK